MKALGFTIEVRVNAGALPLSTLSRSGPIVPVAPASEGVWQDVQPVVPDVKIALPSLAAPPPPPPPPDCCPPAVLFAPLRSPPMNLLNAARLSTVAIPRITAWPSPHSSAQTIG